MDGLLFMQKQIYDTLNLGAKIIQLIIKIV